MIVTSPRPSATPLLSERGRIELIYFTPPL
jgi:hypothetical protein